MSERVVLASSNKEREMYDSMADLYSIFICLEHLEKAFIRDSIPAEEYDKTFNNLFSKYKTLKPLVAEQVPSIEQFMREYRMQCPAAAIRVKKGVSAVKEFGGSGGRVDNQAALIFEIGQHFITLMDCVKLQQTAADQIHPHLSDLVDAVTKLGSSFDGKAKLVEWHVFFMFLGLDLQWGPEIWNTKLGLT
eukprot:TRINITY_DN49458_c0_g1_i1.p1 TRINITY_DN49458_c0_g1~~TRINITY_DN49458_c0_g1_i1.p1  ORF type:complete len:191 (-),score=15.85 TRINITY_DN49458_c0_g1_i1:33-605(-)